MGECRLLQWIIELLRPEHVPNIKYTHKRKTCPRSLEKHFASPQKYNYIREISNGEKAPMLYSTFQFKHNDACFFFLNQTRSIKKYPIRVDGNVCVWLYVSASWGGESMDKIMQRVLCALSGKWENYFDTGLRQRPHLCCSIHLWWWR